MGAATSSTIRCLYCRKKLPTDGRRHRKFCKASCRTLAYRARKRDAPKVDDSSLPSVSPAVGLRPEAESALTNMLQALASEPSVIQDAGSSTGTEEIRTELTRQHEAALAALQRLLDLGGRAQQSEAQLRRELVAAQAALRTRTSDVERLQAEAAAWREQATKREQEKRTEEDTRQRLLQVERYIAVLTAEQEHRREADKAHAEEQLRTNGSLRAELTSSLSNARELEATVQQLEGKQAELTQHLQNSQKRLAETEEQLSACETGSQKRLSDMENQMARREEEILRLQRQLAEQAEAERRLIAATSAQRAALEAEVQRLRQDGKAQQTPGRFGFADATKRLDDMVSNMLSPGPAHAGLVGKLTQERDTALHEHRQLLAAIHEHALLPAGSPSLFMPGDAPLKTRLKNPLVHLLEPTLLHLLPSEALDDNIRRFAVLCAQGRILAMLTQVPGQTTGVSSAHLVRHVVQCVHQHEALFPAEARAWVQAESGLLAVLEDRVTNVVRKQLARVVPTSADL